MSFFLYNFQRVFWWLVLFCLFCLFVSFFLSFFLSFTQFLTVLLARSLFRNSHHSFFFCNFSLFYLRLFSGYKMNSVIKEVDIRPWQISDLYWKLLSLRISAKQNLRVHNFDNSRNLQDTNAGLIDLLISVRKRGNIDS